MKSTGIMRGLSLLVLAALVVTMAPPALSSNAYVNRGGVTAPLSEATRVESVASAPLARSAAPEVAPVRASQVVSSSDSLLVTGVATETVPLPASVVEGESMSPPLLTMTADPFQ